MRGFRLRLLAWYQIHARDLPWRRTRDPYRILVSEVMLQQTRVAAAIPFYERFVERFPDAASLASAPEADVLAAWSGLGYYSRARNLQRAARMIQDNGRFPDTYESIRALPGVGEYTAAAVASIAFGEARAVADGNVKRVLSRVRCGQDRPEELAQRLLDRRHPGDFNQALMELGATICLPRIPHCPSCPVARFCEAHRQGRESEFPVRRARPLRVRVAETVAIVEKKGSLLLTRQDGFWRLPRDGECAGVLVFTTLGRFRHSIMNRDIQVTVVAGKAGRAPAGFQWIDRGSLKGLPLSTLTRKALAIRAREKF